MALLNCSKCGEEKKGSYVKESWCGTCKNAWRKEFKAKRRADLGLPEWGSGRDPKCKICRNPKEDRYMDGSYCSKCKLERLKKAYDEKNKVLGKEPRRVGRNPICKCGRNKENLDQAHCRFCHNESKRLLRQNNMQNPDWVAYDKQRTIARFADSYEEKIKILCRRHTLSAIRHGVLQYQPCEICGVNDNSVQAHHDDYSKPLEVRWLCSWHHAEHHKNEKK